MKIQDDNTQTITNIVPKTQQAILKDLEGKSFAQEIENDKKVAATYINRGSQALNKLGVDNPIAKHEQAAVDVYKRALIAIGAGGLEIRDNNGKIKSAAENNLPVSSYLNHGARVMIEIPSGSGDSFVNWLASGDSQQNAMSREQSQQRALAENKIVYNRSAATHGVSITKQQDETYALKELKGLGIGVKDFLSNKLLGTKTNHFGVDLALNAEFGGKDSEGKVVTKPDGDHGHLYIHYIPPTKNSPGSMLLGIEGGSPSSSKHSITGASDPLSPGDGSLWNDLAVKNKIAGEPEYQNTIVPAKYNGMTLKLDADKLQAISAINCNIFGDELANAMPGQDPAVFTSNLQNQASHISPKFVESKNIQPKLQKPSVWKKIANRTAILLTLNIIKPYQEELTAYNAEQKAFKAQENIRQQDAYRFKTIESPNTSSKQKDTSKNSIIKNFVERMKKHFSKQLNVSSDNKSSSHINLQNKSNIHEH